MATAAAVCTSFHAQQIDLMERVLPLIDVLEITPDTIADDTGALRADSIAWLREISSEVTLVVHGVGLSIGSYDGWWSPYLQTLDRLAEQVPIAWHSEHLGYTRVDGEFLGTMLPVAMTESALELLVPRVDALRSRYGIPFLLENVVHVLPDGPGELPAAEFLNALTGTTGCGLLLDVYNLHCDAVNNDFDIPAFLETLDMRAIGEIHVAGGVAYDGLLLDVHSRPVAAETSELARRVLRDAPNAWCVTFELLDEAAAVWSEADLRQELTSVRRLVEEVGRVGG